MENEQVVDAIIKRMSSEWDDLGDSEAAVVAITNMITALGRIGDLKAAQPIINILEDVEEEEANEYLENLRNECLKALGKIGGQEAIATIISYFDYHKKYVQDLALEAIINIGSPAIKDLISALKRGGLSCAKERLKRTERNW